MTRPVLYVDCDVPEGMTLTDYRAAKSGPRRARRGLIGRLRRRRRPIIEVDLTGPGIRVESLGGDAAR